MQGHPAPPPVISGSPDVTALIDKKHRGALWHGSWTSFHILAFFVQTSLLFSVYWDGPNSLLRNSIPSKFRATVQLWIRGLARSLRLNSPFFWLSVRTQFSRTDEPYGTENSRNCFKSFFSYILVCDEKNDETCRTQAKKYLHSICLQIHADYVSGN